MALPCGSTVTGADLADEIMQEAVEADDVGRLASEVAGDGHPSAGMRHVARDERPPAARAPPQRAFPR